ncbi:hypothetical protein FHS96_003943 [Sphingomonas zeicaulis]|uniref:hypothetical protein n=1 Tax=Sphingomonas zeicaulis TaxID=1632740 RepID=UPI003D1E52B2
MVVDVSVEIAMFARLASVPIVYVRLKGRCLDRPHLDAFRAATTLLAPFHDALDDKETPAWVRARTFYAPAIVDAAPTRARVEEHVVRVVTGRGGGIADGVRWSEAACAAPDRR